MKSVVTKQIKVPITQEISSEYIEEYLEGETIRWAITDMDERFYFVDCAAVVEEFSKDVCCLN